MRSNDYYNLIVSYEPGHWDGGEGMTNKARFHYRTDEVVKARFSPMSDAVEMSLKQFPAIFACETNDASPTPAYVGRITKVEHRGDGYYLHFERDARVAPIRPERLLEMADALDIRPPGRGSFGDLGSSHWSVKQVDLMAVLQRNHLMTELMPVPSVPVGFALPARAADGPIDVAQMMEDALAGMSHTGQVSARSNDPVTPAPRVFIVHGRAKGVKHEVARCLSALGLEPVILDEQVSVGETIIEHFEREAATVRFAVVLLTPDDVGGLNEGMPQTLKPRSRQNVILELGYFAAKLGRGKVMALREGDVEIPSDYSGVRYQTYDDHGGWKLHLARALREAGLPVDMTRL